MKCLLSSSAADCQLSERLDFVSYNLDTPFIRRIQLQHTISGDIPEQLPRRREDRARLACAGRPVEQQVRQIPSSQTFS